MSCSFFSSGSDALGRRIFMKIGHQRLEVGAGGEHLVGRPDHQALVLLLGDLDRLQSSPSVTVGLIRCSFAVIAGDQHLAVQRPDTHFLVPEFLGAGLERHRRHRRRARTSREGLALVDRPASRLGSVRSARAPTLHEPSARVHPAVRGDRTFEHPGGQRRGRLSALPASMSSWIQPRDLLPAGGLPQLERALFGGRSPSASRSRSSRARIGDVAQVHGGVVETVAQDRPQELRLRVGRFAQQLQALGRRASSGCASTSSIGLARRPST